MQLADLQSTFLLPSLVGLYFRNYLYCIYDEIKFTNNAISIETSMS